QFYSLREPPFAVTPDPEFLYPSVQHGFALTMLRYGVMSGAGFCVLTGEVGSGKTLIVRKLLAGLPEEVTVGLLHNLARDADDLLRWVNMAFGLPYAGQEVVALYQQFVDFLLREYAAGRRVALIVDEAQNLDVDMLEHLRLLSNVNDGKHVVLQTFLVGQPELLDTLRLPQLRQFAQRVGIDYHLQPLNQQDTMAYVRHRLVVAGGDPELFSAGALKLVHLSSGGVPRLINQLCDTALVYGFAGQREKISAVLMKQVIEGRRIGGILPTRDPTVPAPALATQM
ncbi:MAG TPA: AAA family ATPase, partial [Steroidobacteraceae bacterium]|nr:AAA family ATPase [Steroidobacteraceae bacterium]